MKILVIGGTHGNERLGVELVTLLKRNPIKGVDALIANPRAVAKKVRFTETDLNRSFAGGESYEQRRAMELRDITAPYDIVLDFHNTQTPDNNCGFVGADCEARLYEALKTFGLRHCIEATTYDCINVFCLNTVSVEISMGDELDDPLYWYELIARFAAGEQMPGTGSLSVYRFLRRVTWEEKAECDSSHWQPFRSLSEEDKRSLKVSGDVVPIFVGSRLTEYYATLLVLEQTA